MIFEFFTIHAEGHFVIDTCCFTPGNHLTFASERTFTEVVPSFTLGVIDVYAVTGPAHPVAICRPGKLTLYEGVAVPVLPEDVDNGSFDPNHDSLILTLEPPGPFSLGVTPITLIVSDGELADSCATTITVQPNRPADATCRDTTLLLRSDDTVCDLDPYALGEGSYDPNGDSLHMWLQPPGPYPIGVHLVTLFVSDGYEMDSCIAVITVRGNAPPVAQCRNPEEYHSRYRQPVHVNPRDLDDGSHDPDGDQLSFALDPPGPFAPGTYPLNLIVSDGDLADTCQSEVTVLEYGHPVAKCKDLTVRLRGAERRAEVKPEDVDDGSVIPFEFIWPFELPPDPTLYLEPPGPFPEGVHEVFLVIHDGEVADSCELTITVLPNEAPIALCSDVVLQTANDCAEDLTAVTIDAGSHDPHNDPYRITMLPSGPYPAGETEVMLVISDGGLADTCGAIVMILPPDEPLVGCPQDLRPVFDANGSLVVPDLVTRFGRCWDQELFTITQSPPAGWFLYQGLDDVAFHWGRESDTSLNCMIPFQRSFGAYRLPAGPFTLCEVMTVDVLPGRCPNLIDRREIAAGDGFLEVAIVGEPTVNIDWIDRNSFKLAGAKPVEILAVDVTSPARRRADDLCACPPMQEDGRADFVLRFDWSDFDRVWDTLLLDTPQPVTVVGRLLGGRMLTGGDCITITDDENTSIGDEAGVLRTPIGPVTNYPNPFNGGTVIRFSTKARGDADLIIFNALGQKVRSLTDHTLTSGTHSAHWDGRDDSGRLLSSGLYFCRVRIGSESTTHKMVLLR